MTDEEARIWLQRHDLDVRCFMDYAPAGRAPAVSLERSLSDWFNNPGWDDGEAQVGDLGFDSTGGQFASWAMGDGAAAAVYFGSEGSFGVLAPTVVDWIRAVALGPVVLAHPVKLYLDEAPRRAQMAREALRRYRGAAERDLGPVGDALPAESAASKALAAALDGWVAARRRTFSMQDMRRWGLQGGPGSGALRARVCAQLGLRKANAKALLKHLERAGVTRAGFEAALAAARARGA